jgi:hypothetical protein
MFVFVSLFERLSWLLWGARAKPLRWGRKPCSRAKYHGKRGQNQGFSSSICVDEALRFSPHPDCKRTDRCFSYACYENPSLGDAFVVEIILTGVLILTVLGATDISTPVGFAGMAIGLVLVLIHLVGIPVTNTSVNPARSIGPALFVGGWALSQLWLFVLAPLLGAALAATVYRMMRQPAEVISARQAEEALASQQAERERRGLRLEDVPVAPLHLMRS